MNPHEVHPLQYFNEWFAQPMPVHDHSVAGVVDALNRHPLAKDESAQDYVMPPNRNREMPGRFRIFGENQDVFHCFVRAGDESQKDPPVYFESCLDLENDYDLDKSEIIENNHILICSRFTDFLWHILGHHICVRSESSGLFSPRVTGIGWDTPIELDNSFINPLGKKFPAGCTCFFKNEVICVPDWGAAFLNCEARQSFVAKYTPKISQSWT